MKNLKRVLKSTVFMGIVAFHVTASFGGEKAGNGGVVFLCPDRVKLVDFWEGEELGNQMKIGSRDASLESLVQAYLERIRFFDEARFHEYSGLAKTVLEDLKGLESNSAYPGKLVRFTQGPLNFSLDSDEINAPRGCEKAQAVTQKEPDIDGETLLTIYRPIWKRLDNEMKVFTIFHELHIRNLVRAQALTYPANIATTRPARLLNQFFGTARLTGKTTICEYLGSLETFGMNTNEAFRYAGLSVKHDPQNVCDPVTRRLLSSPGSQMRMKFAGLKTESGKVEDFTFRFGAPLFSRDSANWESIQFISWWNGEKDLRYIPEEKVLGIEDGFTRTIAYGQYDTKSVYFESKDVPFVQPASRFLLVAGGRAVNQGNGAILFQKMKRLKNRSGAFHRPERWTVPEGVADMLITSDRRVLETIHPEKQ